LSSIPSSESFSYLDRSLSYGLVGLTFLLCFNILNHISEYFFLAFVALGLLKIFYEKSLSHIPTSLDVPILLFLGWIVLTLPFALDPAYSFVEWRKALPRFLIFWLVLQVVRNQSQVKAILHAFVIGLGLLCLIEVIDFFVVGGRALSMDVRAGSFFGAHQWLSNYLVIGGPFLWLSWVSQEYVWEKVMNSLVGCVYPLALFLVHTRSVWLVVLVQISLFILYRITGRFFLSVGLILLSVLAMLISLNLSGEFQNVLSKNDFSNPYTLHLRYNTWNVVLQDVQNSPIVGAGFGKHTFQILHPNLPKEIHKHIHNMFLGTAFQLGIPGLVLFLFLFWKILSDSSSWLRNSVGHESFNSQLAMAICLMTIGVMIRNSFDDMFHGAIVYLFLLFVALGFCLNRKRVMVWSWSKSEA
jgi:O-antigen ligase